MLKKIIRAIIDKRDRNTNMSLEMLKQKQEKDDKEIRDYLDYLVDNIGKISLDYAGDKKGDTLPIGSVIEFASDNVPTNWLLCNGQAVSRTEYAELFAVLGTTWGAGDGKTTFNVPSKEGLVTAGKKANDPDFNMLGKTGGEKAHKLTKAELPAERLNVLDGRYLQNNREVQVGTYANDGFNWPGLKLNDESGNEYLVTEKMGSDQPHNNLQPYVTSNFIIKAKQSAGVVATVVDNLNCISVVDALSANQGKVLNEKKVDKEDGKGLSANDYTNSDKEKGKYITAAYVRFNDNALSSGGWRQVEDITFNIDETRNYLVIAKYFIASNSANGGASSLITCRFIDSSTSSEINWLRDSIPAFGNLTMHGTTMALLNMTKGTHTWTLEAYPGATGIMVTNLQLQFIKL